jgi:hypothetical protein
MGTDKVVFDGVELSEMIARACGTCLHMPDFFRAFFLTIVVQNVVQVPWLPKVT